MPRDGAGNYGLPSGNPVVTNTIISSGGWANPTLSDIATALTQSLSRDGQTTPTADLTMGNFKLRNLANAIARTDAVNAGQIQDGGLTTLSGVSGTDIIIASTAPAITAYTAGQSFRFISAGTNTTGNPTLNINGLGAKNITKNGTQTLAPGDIPSGAVVTATYDGTQFQLQAGQNGFQNVAVYALVAGVQNVSINGAPFTTTGATTFTVPPSGRYYGIVQGGGGGSGGTTGAGSASVGGGAGGCFEGVVTGATPGSTPAITVGAGGTAGAGGGSPTNGGTGGTSSIGSVMSATGGTGGTAANGGVAAGSSAGGIGTGTVAGLSIAGGRSSGAIGLGGGAFVSSAGGMSRYAPWMNFGPQSATTSGVQGVPYGGGASGAIVGGAGATGGDGVVIIRY